MKFQLIVCGLFNFLTHTILRTSKASGITPWKMLFCYYAGPAYYRMCSNDVSHCSKQPRGSTKGTITHHFFVSGIGQKKTVDAAKICGGAENVAKTETAKHSSHRFVITLGHLYSAGSACIAHTIVWVAHRHGQLYLHCSLIYFSPFQRRHSDQPSLRVK